MKNPKEIVRQGYDNVSFAYRGDGEDENYPKYMDWTDELKKPLAEGAKVLDLGCGCGLPATKLLAEKFAVTGVDISEVQIERARKLVPEASFICADMAEISFPAEHFDAIVSFYAIIHLPLEEQPALFDRFTQWLRPQGYLLVTVGSERWTGTEEDWLEVEDAEMYWSHESSQVYLEWLECRGFAILREWFIPEGTGGHTLVLAQLQKE